MDYIPCLFQNPIPTNKPGVEPKRPGRPVDITPLCRLSPTLPNQIEVSWAADFGRVWFSKVRKMNGIFTCWVFD